MTIAAGMWCTDGIVMCADTENTEGNSKWQRTKIWGGGDSLLLTGAGAASYMKMTYDKLAQEFMASRPENPLAARATVEELLLEIHDKHIFPLHQIGHPNANDVGIWLVIAMRCKNGELALIRTELTAASLVDDFEAVGSGREIFKYWARYFLEGNFNMDLASYFSLFMLREAKDVAFGAGGSSYVFKMAKDPSTPKVWRSLWDDKAILAGFPKSAVRVLLAATDLKLPDKAFETNLDMFKVMIRQLRGALKDNVRISEKAAEAFAWADRMARESSASSEPEPPPEQSGGAALE